MVIYLSIPLLSLSGSFFQSLPKIRDIILFPVEYNSILIRTEINVPEMPKMNAMRRRKRNP